MTKTPFKVGDRVVFNAKKWEEDKCVKTKARYEVTVASFNGPGNIFYGSSLVDKGGTKPRLSGGFTTKYFTLVKKYIRDSKGRFLGAQPAKAQPFTPDSIVSGAKYTNSIYPDHEYFGVSLGGVKEMLLKVEEERFTVCSKDMQHEAWVRYWAAFSRKK